MALLDAYHLRGFFKETLLFPPHLNLENFIIIHLIHSSGPEPGGQYAVTTCPMKAHALGVIDAKHYDDSVLLFEEAVQKILAAVLDPVPMEH